MADVWAQSETLRIVRREPLITSAGKILPLQTLTSSRGAGEPASREG
jgi:hypothetical protein